MKPESLLKGRIAETLVEDLLKKAGNKVYRFSYEAVLQNLTQSEKSFDRGSRAGKKIASIPDFLIITKKKKPFFVEVKFRTNPEALEEGLLLEKKLLEEFWEAKIILVTPVKPYFRVLTPPYFKEAKAEGWPIPVFQWRPIQKDPALGVPSRIVETFSRLVKKYYQGKR